MVEISSINYISNTEQLKAILPLLDKADRIALDTEADSLHHYYEKVCLLQVSVPGLNALIDPLAEIDLTAFLEVLSRKQLIIQGADYDLRMMKRDYNFQATDIFDTMLAAQILGYQRFSYAALVEKHCGVVLSKHGQKADWSQRPLPEKLITYAAADTLYLHTVASKLEEELIAANRLHWLQECCVRLLDYVSEGMRTPDPERQWRVKGWHTLKPGKGWAFLREMWRWRDSEAQRADFPPFKVMRNELLVELALWGQNGFRPNDIPKLPRNIYGRRRREMDTALEVARDMQPSEWPRQLETPRRSLPPLDDQLVTGIKEVRDKYASELKIDPGFLLSTSNIATIAATRPKTPDVLKESGGLFQWQVDIMGDSILSVIKNPPPKKTESKAAPKPVAAATPESSNI